MTRYYDSICLAAALIMGLVLYRWGFELWSLSVVLIGLGGIIVRLRFVTLLLPIVLGALLTPPDLWYYLIRQPMPGSSMPSMDHFGQVLLCGSLLAYLVCFFRAHGIRRLPLPPDPRKSGKPDGSRRPIKSREIIILLASLPLSAAGAQLAWALLSLDRRGLDLPPMVWRLIMIIWAIGILLLVASALVGYLERRRMTPEEAAVFLQDQFWRETRGEQRQIGRWLAWARIRHERRKERS